jgi:hypothetical protein
MARNRCVMQLQVTDFSRISDGTADSVSDGSGNTFC